MIQGECLKCEDRGDFHGPRCLVRTLIFNQSESAQRSLNKKHALEAAVLALQNFINRGKQDGMDCQIIPFASIKTEMRGKQQMGSPVVHQKNETNLKTIESVLMKGDLTPLTVEQRIQYYKSLCDSLQLNWMTKPFDYLVLNGKLTLYAKKDCTEQLRRIFKVSIRKLEKEIIDGICIFTATAEMPDGRTDQSSGVVSIAGLKGDMLANAVMKAETKAKRRVTLSICGLGFVDDIEVDSIPGAKRVSEDYQPEEPKANQDEVKSIPVEPSKKEVGGVTIVDSNQNPILCCGKESIVSKFDNKMFYCYTCKSARPRFKPGDFESFQDIG